PFCRCRAGLHALQQNPETDTRQSLCVLAAPRGTRCEAYLLPQTRSSAWATTAHSLLLRGPLPETVCVCSAPWSRQSSKPLPCLPARTSASYRSEEHTAELQSRGHLVC